MIRVLSVNENLETKRANLEKYFRRPVYVVAGAVGGGGDCYYRTPGESEYRRWGALELFLAPFSGDGVCVRREEDGSSQGRRFFDLVTAHIVYLAIPKLPREESFSFASEGVELALNNTSSVSPSGRDQIPMELQPFVYSTKGRGGVYSPKVSFSMSEGILNPLHTEQGWHKGFSNPQLSTIQPPGQYPTPNYHAGVALNWNRLAATARDPGECIVCHGASGERRHFGVIAMGPGPYASNLVCRTCLPQAFEQWMDLVTTVE